MLELERSKFLQVRCKESPPEVALPPNPSLARVHSTGHKPGVLGSPSSPPRAIRLSWGKTLSTPTGTEWLSRL